MTSRTALRVHTWLVYAFLYAPILVLVAYSFNAARRGAKWTGITGAWYAKLLDNDSMRDAAANSLLVAGAATLLSTLVGTAAALGLRRMTRPKRQARAAVLAPATRVLLYLPIVIPEIVLGVALVSFFGLLETTLSLTTVILAHVSFTVSYVVIVVTARLQGLDPSLEEAATDLGAGRVSTFARVTFPLIAPGVIAAALLAFTVSLDDYVVTSFVHGPGPGTLPVKIYSMVHTEVTPEVNAACTVLLALTVVLIAASHRLLAGKAAGR